MRGTAFQPELVEQFLQCIGIYPTGSLVDRLRAEDIVGRIGDSEFGVYLNRLNSPGHALLAARKLAEIGREMIDVEGVEDAATLEALKLMQCDYAQGYFIARPMAKEKCMRWLQERREA